MVQTPSQTNDALASTQAAASAHLAQLPRMSPTAGVSAEDYVAINVTSIVALLLGFTAILAIMYAELLVIPLLATITAVVALRQVKQSNGTQTGRGIAMMGLFLAVSIGSYVAGSVAIDTLQRAADARGIDEACRQLGDDLRDRRYDDAYDQFSQRFKDIEGRAKFVAAFKGMQDELDREKARGGPGPVISASFGGTANYYTDVDTGEITAQGEIDFFYEKGESANPLGAAFRKSGQRWTISSIPSIFQRK